MDALSEVLKVLRLQTGIFLQADFTAPWCIDSAPGDEDVRHILPAAEHVAIYHLLVAGHCRAALADGSLPVDLAPGDLLLVPLGEAHRMGSDLQLAPVRAELLVRPGEVGEPARIDYGGGGERARFLCGYLACDRRLCRPLLWGLPRLCRIPVGDSSATRWLMSLFEMGAAESAAHRPGGESIVARLSELLFIDAVRRYVDSLPPEQSGWFAGLRDPCVSRALAALHADPGRHWTADELAREAALSRSALNERFVRLIGEPPMQYLTSWRMALAGQQLRDGGEPVGRIAERLGYESEAAFNRAFKREFGQPPAAWRRAQRTAIADATTP
jgi:AraC-like DNA-binding protein